MLNVLLAYRCPDEGLDDPRLATLPAGLPWLAASARAAGARVTLANFSRLSWRDVERFLTEAAPDVLAVSTFSANRRPSARLVRLGRKLRPEAVTVAGGPHATAIPGELLRRWKQLDGVLVGEAEQAFGELCRVVAAEGRSGLPQVAGLIGRDQRPDRSTKPVADIDSLAPPPVDLEMAGVEPERDLRWVVMSRARGDAERKLPPALRSAGGAVKEMLQRRKRFGLVDFSLLGVGLAAHRNILPAFAQELNEAKAGVSWQFTATGAEFEPQAEGKRDRQRVRKALELAALAGCRRVRFDLHSGQAPLDTARRQLATASEALRSAGLLPVANLQIGDVDLRSGQELDELRTLLRALRPVEVDLEPRPVLPGHPDVPLEAWFEDERPVLMEAGEARVGKVAEVLEPSIREVVREARLRPRDLESRGMRGNTAWLQIDWGDFRKANGDHAEAARHYHQAAELEPWNAHPWLRLAKLAASREGEGEREALREVLHRVSCHSGARERLDELRSEAERGRRSGRPRRGGRGRRA
jgi:hypothetical protein